MARPAFSATVYARPPAVNRTLPVAVPAVGVTVAVAVTCFPYGVRVGVRASVVVVRALTVTVSIWVEPVGAVHGIVCAPSPLSVPSAFRKVSVEVKSPALIV